MIGAPIGHWAWTNHQGETPVDLESPLPAELPVGYRLDRFEPTGKRPATGWPIVVALEGNGFRRTDSRAYAGRVAAWLNPAGIAVVGLSYPDQHWPDTFHSGLLPTIAHIARCPDFDRMRMGVIGESSGAILALQVGLGHPQGGPGTRWRIAAIGDYYGFTDLARYRADLIARGPDSWSTTALRDYLIPYLGHPGGPADVSASPLYRVQPGSPPVFIAQGTDEKFGTIHSDRLAQRLKACRTPVEYHILPACTHGFGPNGEPGPLDHHYCKEGTSYGLGRKLARFFSTHLAR